MMLRLLTGARNDYRDAIEYYQDISVDLAKYFVQEMNTTFEFIKKHPHASVKISDTLRKSELKRFPYSVIYKVDESEIVISVIHHHKRHPDKKKQ